MLRRTATTLTDPVADPDRAKAPELPDRARRDRRTLRDSPPLEDRDRRHLVLEIGPEPKQVPRADGSREHADVRDLLTVRPSVDLEDGPGDGAVRVACSDRQQLRDRGEQRLDPRTGDRRPEEDRVHECGLRLGREHSTKRPSGDTRIVLDVCREDPLVAFGEHFGQAVLKRTIAGSEWREGRRARPELTARAH